MNPTADLGPVLATYARTPGQNVGVGCFVLFFLALPAGALASASTPFGYVVAAALSLVVVGTIALIARQVLPNWNVRWTLHARGFTRSRAGVTEAHALTEVTAIRFRPGREALVCLAGGKEMLIEGFAGSDALSLRLDEAVARVALPEVQRDLVARGEVTLGPLKITPTALIVGEVSLPWSEVVLRETEVTVAVHGNTSIVWTFLTRSGTQAVEVPMGEVPLPSVVRALIERGCRTGSPVDDGSR